MGSRLPAAAKAAAAATLALSMLLLAIGAAAGQEMMAMSPSTAAAAAAPAHAAMGHAAMAPAKMTAAEMGAMTPAAAAAAPAASNGKASSIKPVEASSSPSSTSTSTSTSTVCPSIARSPTRHVTLVVTGATYVLADDAGKAAVAKDAKKGAPSPRPSLLEGMLAVNGSVLGPTLELEEGEDVSIDVVNEVEALPAGSASNSTATSVHWHGLDLPGAAWADGVAGVTQRAVPRGVSFRYRFEAGPVGTHWYHAHTGLQYANGLRGALIVRPRGKKKSDVGASYDEERLLVISDQAAATAEKVFEELQAGMMSMATMQAGGAGAHGGGGGGGGMETAAAAAPAAAAAAHGSSASAASEAPKAAATHGKRRRRRRRGLSQAAAAAQHGGGGGAGKGMEGMAMGGGSAPPSSSPSAAVDPQSGCFDSTTTQDISDAPYYATLVNGKGFALVSDPKQPGSPPAFAGAPAVVEVKKGKKYRFRLVNAGASWGYNVSVDRHPVALLALDGYPLAVSKAAESGGKKGDGDVDLSAAGLRAVAAVVTTPGETVDFLLDASAPDGVRNYWINVLTLTGYGGPAVLHYGAFGLIFFFTFFFFVLFRSLSQPLTFLILEKKKKLNLKRAPRTPSPRRARGSSALRRPSSAAPTRGTRPLASPTSRTPPT